jgi:hypothetical protein
VASAGDAEIGQLRREADDRCAAGGGLIFDDRERPYYEHRLAAQRDTLKIVPSDEGGRKAA